MQNNSPLSLRKLFFPALLSLCLVLWLSGCGQKGNLYLPTETSVGSASLPTNDPEDQY